MTYPAAGVAEFVNAHFHPIKVNMKEPGAMLPHLRATKPQWGPMFLFIGRRDVELRRYFGWLPPDEFLAELSFVLAMNDLLLQRLDDAYRRLRIASDETPHASIAPEALFWAGAVAYKRANRDMNVLREVWGELATRYPQSTWSRRADLFDQL